MSDFSKTLEFLIRAVDIFHFTPYKWNKISSIVELESQKIQHNIHNLYLPFASTMVLVSLIQVAMKWEEIMKNPIVLIYTSMFIGGIVWTFPAYYCSVRKGKEIRSLLNAVLEYGRKYSSRADSEDMSILADRFGSNLVHLLCKSMALGIYVLPMFSLDQFLNHCQAVFAGYWISPQCRHGPLGRQPSNNWGDLAELSARLFIACLNFQIWAFVAPNIFLILSFVIVKGYSFCCYIELLKRRFMALNGLHIPYRRLRKNFLMFREIQLLLAEYRAIYSHIVLASVAAGGIILQICGICIAIRSTSTTEEVLQPILILACVWVAAVMAIILLYVYGMLSCVFTLSQETAEKVKQNTHLMRVDWFRRFMRSCPILRVYIGADSFVEAGTPLKMEQFVVDQTVSLLLL